MQTFLTSVTTTASDRLAAMVFQQLVVRTDVSPPCLMIICSSNSASLLHALTFSGTRNKEKLDPERVARIKKYVFALFPTTEVMEEKVWCDCRKAIDEFLRRPNKRKNQDRLSSDALESFGLKKGKLGDTPVMGTP